MQAPKKYWWVTLIIVPIIIALIPVIADLLNNDVPSTPTDTPTPTATGTPGPTPTIAPTPIYQSGRITYLSEDEDGKSLYTLAPDGTARALVEDATDLQVLAVSPDGDYLAIAVSGDGDLTASREHPRFVTDTAVALLVVSIDGQESTIVVGGALGVDAEYAPDGQLLVAVLRNNTITYTVAQVDGTNPRQLYQSSNLFEDQAAVTEVP